MENGYEFLTERETVWAEMLAEVLKDNGIEFVTVPVFGAGMTLRTGVRERLRIFVPTGDKPRAEKLCDELFAGGELFSGDEFFTGDELP